MPCFTFPLPLLVLNPSPSPKLSLGGEKLKRDEWNEGAVDCLLQSYESKWILRNRAKLKGQDWEDVARQVSDASRSAKTATQCKNKIESMKKRYRNEVAAGSRGSRWPLFSKIDGLVRCRASMAPSTSMLMVIDEKQPASYDQLDQADAGAETAQSVELNGVAAAAAAPAAAQVNWEVKLTRLLIRVRTQVSESCQESKMQKIQHIYLNLPNVRIDHTKNAVDGGTIPTVAVTELIHVVAISNKGSTHPLEVCLGPLEEPEPMQRHDAYELPIDLLDLHQDLTEPLNHFLISDFADGREPEIGDALELGEGVEREAIEDLPRHFDGDFAGGFLLGFPQSPP